MSVEDLESIPGWIKEATYEWQDGDLDKLNFLKGSYIGHTLKLDEQAERIDDLEEMVDLARAYERERIAQNFEGRLMTNIAGLVREMEDE